MRMVTVYDVALRLHPVAAGAEFVLWLPSLTDPVDRVYARSIGQVLNRLPAAEVQQYFPYFGLSSLAPAAAPAVTLAQAPEPAATVLPLAFPGDAPFASAAACGAPHGTPTTARPARQFLLLHPQASPTAAAASSAPDFVLPICGPAAVPAMPTHDPADLEPMCCEMLLCTTKQKRRKGVPYCSTCRKFMEENVRWYYETYQRHPASEKEFFFDGACVPRSCFRFCIFSASLSARLTDPFLF
jgi:hypothetical protein